MAITNLQILLPTYNAMIYRKTKQRISQTTSKLTPRSNANCFDSLPSSLQFSDNVARFKRWFKTTLFNSAFNDVMLSQCLMMLSSPSIDISTSFRLMGSTKNKSRRHTIKEHDSATKVHLILLWPWSLTSILANLSSNSQSHDEYTVCPDKKRPTYFLRYLL